MRTESHRSTESVVREIKRKTRRKYNAEEKIRIVLEGLKGEESIDHVPGRQPAQCLQARLQIRRFEKSKNSVF